MNFETFEQELGCTFSFITKTMHRIFESGLKKKIKLTQSEIRIIMELSKSEKMKGISKQKQIDLANALGVRPISLSRLIEKMETKNLLTREQSTEDKRIKYVSLNKSAKQVKDAMSFMEDVGPKLVNQSIDGFSDNEKEEFLRLLRKMKECVVKNCF